MTKSTITRERLEEIILDNSASLEEFMAITRMALAAMDSEPVCFVSERNLATLMKYRASVKVKAEPVMIRPVALYRHAQQPVAHIPVLYKGAELLSRSGLELIRDGVSFATDLESACMAEALLAAAQPAPVVSADLLHTAASAIEDLLTTKDRTGAGVWFGLPGELRRAAMLNGGKS
ncbi:hypothetical protein P6O13_001727 [Klebsiella aerogenes]|nr:hypothetical protein [Klebsiella aerogenes]